MVLVALHTAPAAPAAPATNAATFRSVFAGRSVEVIAESAGDQGIAAQQDEERLVITCAGHRIALDRDGRLSIDGIVKAPIKSSAVQILVRGDRVEVRPGD